MSTRLPDRRKELKSKLQRLSKRVDPDSVDQLLDEIFEQIASLNDVSCTLATATHLRLQSGEALLADVELPRARAVLRMLCARLAVRTSELAKRELSPYGDSVEFAPGVERICQVDFANSPDVQKFEIRSGRRVLTARHTVGAQRSGAKTASNP